MSGYRESAALLALVVSAPGCTSSTNDTVADEARRPPSSVAASVTLSAEQITHGAIQWTAARESSLAETIEVPGRLVPNEDRTAEVAAPVRGRVIAVHVGIGDRVSRGQPMVTLQSQDAATARADYRKALADLNARRVAATYAHAARERADRLLELKAISRQEVERVRTDDEVAIAARAEAEADVERARAALTQLGVDIETGDVVLRAPLAGVVLSRDALPGSVVDAGGRLLTVSDVSTLWLDIAGTERVAARLRHGAGIRFTVPAFPSDTFDAAVENVGAALDPATRTLPVRAAVRNNLMKLRPEMFATVRIELGEPRVAVVVTSGALQSLDERPVVFVAHPDGEGGARFERRDVETGARTDVQVQIVRGIAVGDLVVTDGAFMVKSAFARGRVPAGS